MLTHPEPGLSGRAFLTIVRALGRFVFPSQCLACRQSPVESFLRGGICQACWEQLPLREAGRCEVCDEALPALDAPRCGRCLLEPPPFDRLVAAAPYRGPAREALLAFKFRGADFLARHLAALMAGRLALPADFDEVTAVPAIPRAPHAAHLLAAALARRLGLPFAALRLEKRRTTARQSGLPLERRAANVRGAFRARRPAPPRVLLVDDVATSGATARECAAALQAAGAREVTVCCFARASRTDIRLEPEEEQRADR